MPPLRYTLLGSCPTTSARAADLVLGHTDEVANTVHLPIFMPVGTQVTPPPSPPPPARLCNFNVNPVLNGSQGPGF